MGSNCVITNGLNLTSCVNNIPGLESLYVLTTTGSTAEINTIVFSGDGRVQAFSASTNNTEFKKIDVVRNSSAALNESVAVNLESLGFDYQTQLIFTIPGIQQVNGTNLYQQLVQNVQSYFLVKLKTGRFFLASPLGMYVESAAIASGSLPGDSQLYTLTLTSSNVISVPEVAVSTTLTAFLAANTNITLDRE
jgi:hypothetical protein